MNNRLKMFLKGFVKGLMIIVIYFAIISSYALLQLELQNLPPEEILKALDSNFSLGSWLLGFFIISYLVQKYKLMKGWLVAGLIFTIYLVPFMMGNVELLKYEKSGNRKRA